MQAQPYYPTAPTAFDRRKLFLPVLLITALLAGVAIGYLLMPAKVTQVIVPAREATLLVQVENASPVTQAVRIFVNNDQVEVLTIATGGTVSTSIRVGWTNTANGMYEVRATPVTTTGSDADRIIVTDGQTSLIQLRVT